MKSPDGVPAIDMPSPPATPDPLVEALSDDPTPPVTRDGLTAALSDTAVGVPPAPEPPLLEFAFACPCGHRMVVGAAPADVHTMEPRRFAMTIASQIGVMFAQHLSTVADVAAAYDRVPLNKRGADFPSKEDLLAEVATHEPCLLRKVGP